VGRRHVINPVSYYPPIRSYNSPAVRIEQGALLFTSAEAPSDLDGGISMDVLITYVEDFEKIAAVR